MKKLLTIADIAKRMGKLAIVFSVFPVYSFDFSRIDDTPHGEFRASFLKQEKLPHKIEIYIKDKFIEETTTSTTKPFSHFKCHIIKKIKSFCFVELTEGGSGVDLWVYELPKAKKIWKTSSSSNTSIEAKEDGIHVSYYSGSNGFEEGIQTKTKVFK